MNFTDDKAVRVSIVMVSDYEPGKKSWADERASIRAFLDDDPGFPFEIIVMEALTESGSAPPVPADIASLAPKVAVHFAPSHRSSALKDAGLAYCRADLIAVVEADSLPQPGWLKHLVSAMAADPSLDVISGRTIYGSETAMLRVATLLDRGFAECRFQGRFVHVSNNGALYRRKVLERFPYPADASPYVSAELRSNAMHKAGIRVGLERRAVMRHAYGGIGFMADVRRNKGFQAARMLAQASPRGAARPTILLAASAVRLRWRFDVMTVRQVGGSFLHRTDWPLLIFMLAAVRLPEFAGALAVRQPERFATSTAYR